MKNEKLMNELSAMSIEDLKELNHTVVSLIRHKQSLRAVTLSSHFHQGDKVSFTSSRRGKTVGVIEKMNPKKVIVRVASSDPGMTDWPMTMSNRWNVPYSMLTKIV